MKIGFIGGVKHGDERNVLEGHDKTKLDWEVRADLPLNQQSFQTNARAFTIKSEHQTYQLKVLKKNGELKYFYILKDFPREEIETGLIDCWELSDNLGYDFD